MPSCSLSPRCNAHKRFSKLTLPCFLCSLPRNALRSQHAVKCQSSADISQNYKCSLDCLRDLPSRSVSMAKACEHLPRMQAVSNGKDAVT